jgi:hypothetical protein
VLAGTVWYLLTCVQGPLQSVPALQKVTHFNNWTVGHSHIAVLGFSGYIALGAMWLIVPQLTGRRVYSGKLVFSQFWLITFGLTGFLAVLTIAGLIQGQAWYNGEVVVRVLPEIHPYMILRLAFGLSIISGAVVGLYNLLMTLGRGERFDPELDGDYFWASISIMVVMPALMFHPSPSDIWRPLTPAEEEGNQLYTVNGCSYCHSQFIRVTDWGHGAQRIAEAGDYVGRRPVILARSAPARTSLRKAENTRTIGTSRISPTRASPARSRSCRAGRFWARRRSASSSPTCSPRDSKGRIIASSGKGDGSRRPRRPITPARTRTSSGCTTMSRRSGGTCRTLTRHPTRRSFAARRCTRISASAATAPSATGKVPPQRTWTRRR